jgi:large subunit ribosomal protein L1
VTLEHQKTKIMATLTKKRKLALSKYDSTKAYSLEEATKIIKEISSTKFDSSVDLSIFLGIDPKKGNQMVRGTVNLPHGSGKKVRILVLCTPDKEAEAKAAGADYVGLDDYIQKIKEGWTDVDVVITMPSVMGKVGAIARVLGPRGLMPNPKTGTVTMDIAKAVTESRGGKIDFKADKQGGIHSSVAKASFDSNKIYENANELLQTILKLKPASAKGAYIRSIFLSGTMSPSIRIDTRSLGV